MALPHNCGAAAAGAGLLPDAHRRPLASLRLSVIDRCDLRCRYCMPEEHYAWLPRDHILGFDEVEALMGAFAALGVSRLRLTGGEPLLRPGLGELVARLAAVPGIGDLALTTNGTRLAAVAAELRRAGLRRVTVSLDTLRRDRFLQLTRRDQLHQVLGGLEAACAAGFAAVKVNTVVIRGFNDDEIGDLLEFCRQRGVEPRFIEYMDVGGATCWTPAAVMPRSQVLAKLEQRFGPIRPEPRLDTAPADRFLLPDGTRFGVIASVSEPFCGRCDRSRLTADGRWYLCLYAREGIDLRRVLRREGQPGVLRTISAAWRTRADRGAEQRRHDPGRGVLYQVEELRQDPHREMHTRGG